jgi:MFS family permease
MAFNRDYSHAWRALTHRNFRLYFGGQTISLIGTWMTRLATSWLVYRLTGSALLLGLVGFAGQIPAFLVAPCAGVWVDRLDRQRVLVVTQGLAMLQSLGLAVLTLAKVITIHEIIALSALQGIINAFDMPARQSFMVRMVEDRQDLGNAIAINSSMVNMAQLVGPSIAGIVIAGVGEGYCFLIDGISYMAVIASLLLMRLPAVAIKSEAASMLKQFKEGWSYVSGFVPVRSILVIFAIIGLMGWPYMVLMPIFAGKILKGGPDTLGFLTGAVGIGALVSGVSLAMRRTVLGLDKRIPIAAALLGGGLILFAMSRVLWLSMVLMFFTGFGLMQVTTICNTLIQTIVPEEKRGRAMSFYTMAFVGMAPFGSLLAGSVANKLGAPIALTINGLCCIAGSIWFATRLKYIRTFMHPIFVDLGILPPEVIAVIEDQV